MLRLRIAAQHPFGIYPCPLNSYIKRLFSMASSRAELASSSTPRCLFHVFLSFRGEDTRKTFTDHLYKALWDAGFCTFRDNNGIEKGEDVKLELDKAIKGARSSIIVFSKGYASSRWCLDELLMILERKRTSGHVIIPIFYHVEPTFVRHQTGSFAEAFSQHEEQVKVETDKRKKESVRNKVRAWRTALEQVAGLSGIVINDQNGSTDGYETKILKKIVEGIRDKLPRSVLHVSRHLIGMESRFKNINSWVQDESADVGIAVIDGMGGIGKTTIAKCVYNLNFGCFEASSFLANIRETSEQPNGLVLLQQQLISDILKRGKETIWNDAQGMSIIKEFIGCRRVLVILDDVDKPEQLDALIGSRDYFHSRSKIIVTTRKKDLLKASQVDKVFEVKGFDFNESLELFSWHAFEQDRPMEGYIEHSKQVVKSCEGLPLALKVLGTSLSGLPSHIWKDAIQKLAAIPEQQILEKLRISYDFLDDKDRNLFLDIACFFIGKRKDFVERVLGCDFPKIGIQNLMNGCLLTIEGNKLRMHQLLRDMGREIVRQQSLDEPGNRTRLWHHEDSFEVLKEQTGSEKIEGLFLDMHLFEEDRSSETSFDANNNGKRPRFEELNDELLLADRGRSHKRQCLGLLSWLPIKNSNRVELKTDAFAKMRKLRLLRLNYVVLNGGYKNFPKRLRWLCWDGFPQKIIPNDFPLKSVVDLELHNSKLVQVWKGAKVLKLLKKLDLSHSHDLRNTPDFTNTPNLETLVLKDCINLVEVHESIGELRKFVSLNLKGCKNIKKLSCKTWHLLPLNEFGSFCFWSWVLKPSGSTKSLYSPLACLPRSILKLTLSRCNLSRDDLEIFLGSFSGLQDLDLSLNPFSSVPESIKGLTSLQSLGLSRCERLQSLPELPMNLESLSVDHCTSLETVANLPNLLTSLKLDMRYCKKLLEVQGMIKLEPIGNADVEILKDLGFISCDNELFFGQTKIGSLEVVLYNKMTNTLKYGPLQGLYECGIYNIFLPWSEFSAITVSEGAHFYSSKNGSSTSFNVRSRPNLKMRALNVHVVCHRIRTGNYDFLDFIKISNETKGLKWVYSPTFSSILLGDMMLWLSHWKIGNQILLEDGDQVIVSAAVSRWRVMEVGVEIVYDEHEERGFSQQQQHHHHSTNSCHHNAVTNVVDLSPYHVSTIGSYFLCHHDYLHHQYYRQHGRLDRWHKVLLRKFEDTTTTTLQDDLVSNYVPETLSKDLDVLNWLECEGIELAAMMR